MRIVVDINHPAHVHYFKYFIQEMRKKGHEVLLTASEKDIIFSLLENYHLEYVNAGNYGNSQLQKLINIPIIDFRYYTLVKTFKPDILMGAGSIRAAHASFLLNRPCINFEDTEHSNEQIRLYMPFVKVVCTPSCFGQDLGKKQVRFDGYLELASLHPNRFTPNPAVLNDLGLTPDDVFIIVRFVSWRASHDVGQHGIRDKLGFVKALERYGRILITSEGALPEELQPYRIRVSPDKLHDLLYYATLYIGEGATTASECAVLGTHAIYVNTLGLGYIAEESAKYDLVSDFSSRVFTDKTVLAEATRLLENKNLKNEGRVKSARIVREKCDVTAFMIWFVEQYPTSIGLMENHQGDSQKFFVN
jgi:uncharacterized protein